MLRLVVVMEILKPEINDFNVWKNSQSGKWFFAQIEKQIEEIQTRLGDGDAYHEGNPGLTQEATARSVSAIAILKVVKNLKPVTVDTVEYDSVIGEGTPEGWKNNPWLKSYEETNKSFREGNG